jgi:transcriptional regulator with XRE-family HTH domain
MNQIERDFAIELGRRVNYARRNTSMTQHELGAGVGVHRVTISRLESGRLVASAGLLERCAVVLNVPLRALVPRTNPRAAA